MKKRTLIILVSFCLLCANALSPLTIHAEASNNINSSSMTYSLKDIVAGDCNLTVNESEQLSLSNSSIQIINDGVYYLNGKYSGDYLRNNSGSIDALSGLVSNSSLGTKIKWTITSTNNGYTIRSLSDSTIYLGVPTNTGSTSVEAVYVSSGSAVPSRCYWEITIAQGGGCHVKSCFNN